MKTISYVLGVAILVILAVAIGLAFKNKDANQVVAVVTSYEECAAAGYPIMESYPEQCRTPDGRIFTHIIATSTIPTTPAESNGSTPGVETKIRVTSPIAMQTVSSGFELSGEARGYWYFEASFPVKLVDANGKVLAQFAVQAIGDWMSDDFVPFKKTVTYTLPETATGNLILMNDNPSGLPENQQQLVIPVKFASSSAETMSVKAFFNNSTLAGAGNTDCSKVFAVTRAVPKTSSTGKAALEELLKGASASEKASGYSTTLNAGVKLNSLTVNNGVAQADFSKTLDSGVAGSCKVTAIRAQIEQTLKQFSSVKQVVISVDGEVDQTLQP